MSVYSLEATAPPVRRNLFMSWIPTLAWLCLLAAFSTDTFSAEHTGSILEKVLRALFGEISHQRFVAIHFLIRKSAHFCSYGAIPSVESLECSLERSGAAAHVGCGQRR